jgi:uncharacterized membrane protein
MESRVKLLGHPVHQMLIPLPAGLFIAAALLDILDLFVDAPWIATVTYWNIMVGVCTALLAALFGLADWLKIPDHTRAKRVGAVHGLGNVGVVALFAGALYLRSSETVPSGYMAPLMLEVFAMLGLGITAWLGGELVDRMGVGVDDGAHVNAPSSLRVKHVHARGRMS